MADTRITEATLLVLARNVPCLTRWAQCWKISTVRPLQKTISLELESFTEYSNEVLFPWVESSDPRNCRNDHQYSYSINGFQPAGLWRETIGEAIADAAAEEQPVGDPSRVEGWRFAGETDRNEVYPAAPIGAELAEQVPLMLHVQEVGTTSEDSCATGFCCQPYSAPSGVGSATVLVTDSEFNDAPGGTDISNFQGYEGLTFSSLEEWEQHITQSGPMPTSAAGEHTWNLAGSYELIGYDGGAGLGTPIYRFTQGGTAANGQPNVMNFQCEAQVICPKVVYIAVRRVPRAPSPPCMPRCEDPYPDFPGLEETHCDIFGTPESKNGYGLDTTQNYKVLSRYYAEGEVVLRYPRNPARPEGHSDYENQAFWENAYADAVLAGELPGGMTYQADGLGGIDTYPRVQDFGYIRQISYPPEESTVVVTVSVPSLRFTSHDLPVTFRGEEYTPCNSLSQSAAELGAVLGAPGNTELAGIIADAGISESDLAAGAFDRAQVEVWMVPWENAGGEIPFRLHFGIVGDISQGEAGHTMEVLTPGALIQQQALLPTYTPSCRWELGDARCAVDLDALAVSGAATSVAARNATTRAHHRVFWDSSRAEADGYFDEGRLEWTSGPNEGQSSEIKSFAGGQFVLWQPAQYPIGVGDEYEARPGCDKLPATCKDKFSNYANFGGFPDVPGRDGIMQTPDSKG